MEKQKAFLVGCLVILFLVAPSCEEYDENLGQSGEEDLDPYITGGSQTNGYPSVGYLTNGGVFCTATLIGPRTVLTAAHCINASSGKFNAKGKSYGWSKAKVHPNYNSNTLSNDLAVVTLNSTPSGITPSPINTSPVSAGQQITLVGHGYTTEGGGNAAGKKYVGTNKIDSVSRMWIEYTGDSTICSGDSGGPSFVDKKVVGVHSWGVGGERCTRREAGDTRVDTFASWIKSQGDISAGGGDDGAADNPDSCHTSAPGNGDYCSSSCPCNEGEGDCDKDSDCKGSLICKQQSGTDFCVKFGGGGDGGSCEGKCSPTCRCGWTEIGCKKDNDCQPGLYCKIRPQLGNRCLKRN